MVLSTLCYVKKNGYTLMLHKNRRDGDIHSGKWNGLGGKLNAGETPEECVIREVEEESGLVIRNPSLRGFLTFPAFKDGVDWYVHVFVAHQFNGNLRPSSEGIPEWIQDERLLELNLWEGDPIFMKRLDENRFFSGKFVYQEGKLISHELIIHQWQISAAQMGGKSNGAC